jgi:hypothetical protein
MYTFLALSVYYWKFSSLFTFTGTYWGKYFCPCHLSDCYVRMLQDGYCHIDNVTLTAKITGYVNVTSGDADALKVALVKHGPISVAIDASRKTFSFYSNGIYYDPECGKC